MKKHEEKCVYSCFCSCLVVRNRTAGNHRGSLAAAHQKMERVEVKIDHFRFGLRELTVSVGTTVTWTNRDDIPHTVVSMDKVFKSKVLGTNERSSFKFDKAGT